MPDEHSLLSPSSAYQWIACPPSIKASEGYKDTAGSAAEEGTLAHSVCEFLLNAYLDGNPTPELPVKLTENKYYNADMLEHCGVYIQQIANYYTNFKKNCKLVDVYVEQRVDLSKYIPNAFGTADCVVVADGMMEVFDFKYGKGVEVSAINNPQMRLYALGAYDAVGFITGVSSVTTHIIQPRIGNTATHELLTIAELQKWGYGTVYPAAKKALAGEGEFNAGEHCRFCKIRTMCRARALHYINELPEGVPASDPVMGTYELERILPLLNGIKKWCEETTKTCVSMALSGAKFEGYKLVAGRGKRIITDPDKMAKALSKGGITDIYKPQELKTLTDLEKLVGKKAFNVNYGNLLVKQEGAPTLAPNSDRREEIQLATAEDDFGDIMKKLTI